MNKTLQLLTVKDFVHCPSVSRHSLFTKIVAQFERQHFYLDTLRIRHPVVLQTFERVIDNSKIPMFEMDSWVHMSKSLLTSTLDTMVADGSNWNGQGVGTKNLIQPLNDICKHTLHATLCLDLLSKDATEKGLIRSDVAVGLFMERVVEDISSFSKEKFGVCPEIQVTGDCQNMSMQVIPPFFEFIAVEVLKNAIKAVIDRYGALDIDDAPPILIHLKENTQSGSGRGHIISFQDHGIGMPKEVAER